MMVHAVRLCCVLLALGVAVDSRATEGEVEKDLPPVSLVANSDKHRFRRKATNSLDWNIIVDGLLVQARANVIEGDKDTVPIPDIDERFEMRILHGRLKGNFEATQGSVNSVSSIKRTGDVFFGDESGQTVTLTTHLGFETLQVHYNHYRMNFFRQTFNGDISASVSGNSVRLKARLVVSDTNCSLALEEVSVLDLSGFDVGISGLSRSDRWVAWKIATWVANKRRSDIIPNLERALRRNMEKAIEKFNCDEHLNEIRDFQGLGD